MTKFIDDIIVKILDKINITSTIMLDKIKFMEENFIHKSSDENLLPIPVLSTISPENPIQFLIHIILSMGKYQTEMDAMNNPSFYECFHKVELIGDNTDEESLKQYINNLTRLYIESQVVYYPNSIKKLKYIL